MTPEERLRHIDRLEREGAGPRSLTALADEARSLIQEIADLRAKHSEVERARDAALAQLRERKSLREEMAQDSRDLAAALAQLREARDAFSRWLAFRGTFRLEPAALKGPIAEVARILGAPLGIGGGT